MVEQSGESQRSLELRAVIHPEVDSPTFKKFENGLKIILEKSKDFPFMVSVPSSF